MVLVFTAYLMACTFSQQSGDQADNSFSFHINLNLGLNSYLLPINALNIGY